MLHTRHGNLGLTNATLYWSVEILEHLNVNSWIYEVFFE